MFKVRSCLIDGEAVACNKHGLAVFERLRYRRADASVFLYAFDLLKLDGADLRASRSRRAKRALKGQKTKRRFYSAPATQIGQGDYRLAYFQCMVTSATTPTSRLSRLSTGRRRT
jgi:ATP-dependent DNA ligase